MVGKTVNGEYCPNSLSAFVKRGDFYAGVSNGAIVVHHGSEHGYPLGDSVVIGVSPDNVADLIAVLRAAQDKFLKDGR